jgi:DNA modification methylase
MNRLNEEFGLKNGGFSNYENTLNLARHRWYYYKEGFSPLLVENAIEQTQVKKDDLIIDPFNGSGTTTLTASMSGYNSIGIEVNPFTSFLSETKIKNADLKELRVAKSVLLDKVAVGKPSELLGFSTFSETDTNHKWLFNDSVLNSFQGGWDQSTKIPSYNIKRLSKLALIISAMKNCNARRDGKCLRYRPGWQENGFNAETFLSTLSTTFERIEEDINSVPIKVTPKIFNGDCRRILNTINIKPFKLCITSPPYLNTFDYTDIYRPELFLGKFINNRKELYDLRLKTVRSHVQAKWNEPTMSNFGYLYKEAITHLNDNKKNLMHKNIPLMVQAYFEDMFNILKILRSKAENSAQVWFVVSNSAYAGMEIPVDLIIGDIATKAGWYLKEIGVLRYLKKRKTIHSSNINELRESVIILSASK